LKIDIEFTPLYLLSTYNFRFAAAPYKGCGGWKDFRLNDSRFKINPQSWTHSVIIVVDTVAIAVDRPGEIDESGVPTPVTGRPEPPT
jgi:hypothetical protein